MNRRLARFGKVMQWSGRPYGASGDILRVSCGEDEWGVPGDQKEAYYEALIQELSLRLSGKANENAGLLNKIDELTQRLDRHEQLLKEIFDPSDLPVYGTFEQWRASGEPANPYRGKHVAFVAGKGVIASSGSLDELMETVEKMGKPEGLIIGFVPIAAALVSKC